MRAAQWDVSFTTFDDFDFTFGQSIQFINQFVNLAVGRINFSLDHFFLGSKIANNNLRR